KEFALRRSFAYTVVTPDESQVLGCVYINPSDTHDARVWMWLRRSAWEDGLDPSSRRLSASGFCASGPSRSSTGPTALSQHRQFSRSFPNTRPNQCPRPRAKEIRPRTELWRHPPARGSRSLGHAARHEGREARSKGCRSRNG